jgi:hypothetical protein
MDAQARPNLGRIKNWMDMTQPIIRLRDAQIQHLKWYFNGEPCPRGHIAMRYTACRACVQCRKEDAAAKRARPKKLPRDHVWRQFRFGVNSDR